VGSGELGSTRSAQPREIIPRVIGRPSQRRGRDQQKPLGRRETSVAVEFFRLNEAGNRMMLCSRLQVLPNRQEIDVGSPQIVHYLQDLGFPLAEPHHHSGFCKQRRIEPLGLVEQPQRMKIPGARPHFGIKTRHSLQIVVEHVRLRRNNGLERPVFAQKVGGQHLSRCAGRTATDRGDGASEMLGAAVIEIIAIDGGDDHVREAQRRHGFADALGFMRVEQIGPAGCDITEGAGPRADPPQDHDGRMPLLPALADIRAGCFFAYGVERELAHEPPRGLVFRRNRRFDAQPVGLARDRVVGIAGLFGMAQRRSSTIMPDLSLGTHAMRGCSLPRIRGCPRIKSVG
jgi:hypothetical protein